MHIVSRRLFTGQTRFFYAACTKLEKSVIFWPLKTRYIWRGIILSVVGDYVSALESYPPHIFLIGFGSDFLISYELVKSAYKLSPVKAIFWPNVQLEHVSMRITILKFALKKIFFYFRRRDKFLREGAS